MKKIKKIMVVSLCALMVAGCGKTIPKMENGDEVLTTLKDDRKISVNDFYNKLKEQHGLETLINTIDSIILEDKYKDDIEAAKQNASSTMEQLKTSYGDDLLQAIQYYTSYNTLEEYEASLVTQYLQQKAITDYAKKQVNDSEIKKYYKDEIKPDIKVSHILITVNVSNDATDDQKAEADEAAKKKAEEVISKLKSANKVADKFSELAKEYSEDDSTKEDGGNLGFINTDTLGDNYKQLVDAAYKLKDGEYTKDVVKSELGYHVVLRTETKEKASIDDVKDKILDDLAKKYITEHADTQIKAMQELRKEYNMDIIDSDLHDKYVNYIQNSLAQIQQQQDKAKENNNNSNSNNQSNNQ